MSTKSSLEDLFSSRVLWKVLRLLMEPPWVIHSSYELAHGLNTSRSAVLRVLKPLAGEGILLRVRRAYRIDPEQEIVYLLWRMLLWERYRQVPSRIRNALDLLMERAGKELELLVLFGSVARGEHLPESDVDICVVGGDLRRFRYDFFPVRFEVHEKTREEFCGMEDSVVLDCLMRGMPLKGEEMVYEILKGLSSFPKSYLIHRLNQARRFLEMGEKAKEGAARDYFMHLARINLAKCAGILRKGKAASLRKAGAPGLTEETFLELHEELGRRGDRIWLTGST